jgi:hypothetical protein
MHPGPSRTAGSNPHSRPFPYTQSRIFDGLEKIALSRTSPTKAVHQDIFLFLAFMC